MASITDQNYLVWNQGKNPLVNFNFMLRVELLFDLPCKSVRAFTRELEYEFIQEGGLNDYVHMRRKPITKPFVLEVERYVGVDYVDPLPLGADLVLPVLLFVSRSHDQFIPGVVARTYVFTGCTVMKKTYGDLVADQSGLLVETTTIGYREMLCVDIPWSEVGDNIFASTPTVPTQAATIDKSAQELKELGQELYEKAKQAKAQADSEYAAADAQTLIQEMEAALKDLNAAVGEGGALEQQVETGKELEESCARELEELTEAAAASEIQLRQAQTAMAEARAQWQPEENAYQQALDEAQKLKEQAERAKQQLEKLNTQEESTALEEQKKQLEQELKELQDQDGTLQENLKSLEEKEQELQKLEQEAERSQLQEEIRTLRDQTRGKSYTGLITQTQNKIDGVTAQLEQLQEEQSQAEQTAAELESQYQQAQQQAQEKKPSQEKQSAYEKATAEWAAAAAQAQADEDAVKQGVEKRSKAVQQLSQARQEMDRGKKQATRLQNSLTNLKTWKEKGAQAQSECTTGHDACKSANDELQKLPDEPLADVNAKDEEAKKAYKETTYQEKQVRQAQQYVEAGREELASARAIVPAGAESDGDGSKT